MKDSLRDAERKRSDCGRLALASDKLQCSLPVTDTPLLVEELLEAHIDWADYQLRELAQPPIIWPS